MKMPNPRRLAACALAGALLAGCDPFERIVLGLSESATIPYLPAARCESPGLDDPEDPPTGAEAAAQCSFPACTLPDERYDAASGLCLRGPAPFTGALSHRIPTCGEGERFDRTTGHCVLTACRDRGCETQALCTGDSRYTHSSRDAAGVYGVCQSGPNWLGHLSHAIRRCPEGFVLNEARGVCVGNCAPPVPLPDLVIRRVFLRADPGGPVVTRIRRGRRYLACFQVANAGAGASGPFQVRGGGLGVPTAPTQAHAALLPGAGREGCLPYPATPPAGTYRLGIEADFQRTVRETREDNNAATLVVSVVP